MKMLRKFSANSLIASIMMFSALSSIQSANAAECPPVNKSSAGLYELSGVMETGSIIILLADGRFGYQLTYGAYDEWAKGCWSVTGAKVSLTVRQMEVNHPDGKKFKKLTVSLNAKGDLVRTENGKAWGTYQRVQKY